MVKSTSQVSPPCESRSTNEVFEYNQINLTNPCRRSKSVAFATRGVFSLNIGEFKSSYISTSNLSEVELGRAYRPERATVCGMLKSALSSLLLRCQYLGFTQLLHSKRQLRLCHDNGGRGGPISKPPKTKTKKKELCTLDNRDANGEATSVIVGQLNDIISGRVSADRLKVLGEFLRRLDALVEVGCTHDEVWSNPDILKLTEQEVLQRAGILKGMGQSTISADLLLIVGSRKPEKVHTVLEKREKIKQFLCKVLDCSDSELKVLEEKHSLFKKLYVRRMEDLKEKVRILQQYSVGPKDLQESPEILNVRRSTLLTRMRMFQKLREEGKIFFQKWPLNILAARKCTFNLRLEQALDKRREIDGTPLSYASLASLLGLMEKDLHDVIVNIRIFSVSTAYNKIQYLLSEGLHAQEILNHIYIIRHRKSKLEAALKMCHDLGFKKPPMPLFLSFLRTGQLPKTSGCKFRQRHYLCTLLGLDPLQFTHPDSLRPVWAAERLLIKRNFDFLASEGFSVNDLLSCITILAHDNNILREYYQQLWQRPDVEPFAGLDVWKDKKRTLNLLQYVLEKDMNFSSQAFDAFIELGHESHTEHNVEKTESKQE